MPISPLLRTPLTDLTGTLFTHQDYSKCGELEMKTINCFEAYGHMRALKACADLMDDYKECFLKEKQKKRIQEMRAERHRQIASGERSKEEFYGEGPKLDSFQH